MMLKNGKLLTMKDPCYSLLPIFILALIILPLLLVYNVGFVEAGKKKIHIPDELDDVVDNEEDDTWKEWGKKSTKSSSDFDPPPNDFSNMDMAQIQAEMMKRTFGPVLGFVKLRLGVRRTRESIAQIAMKWTKVLRAGALGVRFMGVDISTIMFNLENGQDTLELKEFVLSQPEAYEIKIGDQTFRRPGDPPIDEVFAKMKAKEKENDEDEDKDKDKDEDAKSSNDKHLKDEL